jgi:hypothetical protein
MDCRGFGRCAGHGPIDIVCQRPRTDGGLAAPITDGPFQHLGKALQLGQWTVVDAQIMGSNVTSGPGPPSFSWAHVDASSKLTMQRRGFTLQVSIALDTDRIQSISLDLEKYLF